MTLKDVQLKPEYISLRDDVAGEFYVPVMKECKRFDRISCYFSARALSSYCVGLYYLGKINRGKYRLIISSDVTEETFKAIRSGYEGSLFIDELCKERMRERLSLDDRINLSNLAYLMKCGIVEVKFGCCLDGLFHSKSGYVSDDSGNELCFIGSNNETKQSIESNYEKFQVTASWLSSEFNRSTIENERIEFETLWSNNSKYAVVFDPPESFEKYMDGMNRGRLFADAGEFISDSFFLDYSGGVATLHVPENLRGQRKYSPESLRFRLRVQSLVGEFDDKTIVFKNGLRHRSLNQVYSRLQSFCDENNLRLELSDAFFNEVCWNSKMQSLALLGTSIKQKRPEHEDEFKLFSMTVNRSTSRELRPEQLWDSFLLYRLSKAANFSVPGSGKTATVLGTFAYLKSRGEVDRIVLIGPLNSFDSWINEFKIEFRDKIEPKVFRSDESKGTQIITDLTYNSGRSNLLLFNYECFDNKPRLVDLLSKKVANKTLLVFDEVHRVKKIDGERAKCVIEISKHASYIVVMSGTPIPNSYSDAYNFLHILFGEDDYDEYFGLNPDQLQKLSKSDMQLFNHKLYPFFCRTTKSQLNVPPANKDNIVKIPASQMENEALSNLKHSSINPLAMIVRMLQLESDIHMLSEKLDFNECKGVFDEYEDRMGYASDDKIINQSDFREMPSSKTLACADLVDKLVHSGKKVVLWCIFRQSMNNLEAILSSRGIPVCQINGETINRAENLSKFKSDSCSVLITNPQTLAESISLHDVCHDAVYFEYSYNLVHLLQSKDRINRLGLPDGQYTQYHFLEMEFILDERIISLDREIHDRLKQKENVMLDAIENNQFEQFPDTISEVEQMLIEIGMIDGEMR